jgi:hypothetical protein
VRSSNTIAPCFARMDRSSTRNALKGGVRPAGH